MVVLVLILACTSAPPSPAGGGVLDLRAHDLSEPVRLDGGWAFERGLTPPSAPTPATTLSVPSAWPEPATTGTYRLRVLLPPDPPRLALRLGRVASAHQLWIDGSPYVSGGVAAAAADETVESTVYTVHAFQPSGPTLDLVVQAANHRFRMGGMRQAPVLGASREVLRVHERTVLMNTATAFALVTMATVLFVLFGFRQRGRELWSAGAFCAVFATWSAFGGSGDLAFLVWPGLPWSWAMRIEYVAFALSIPAAVEMMDAYLRVPTLWWGRAVQVAAALVALAFVVLPMPMQGMPLAAGQALLAIGSAVTVHSGWRAWRLGRATPPQLVLLVAPFLVGVAHDAVRAWGWVHTPTNLAPTAFLLMLAWLGFTLVRDFARTLTQVEHLSATLTERNADLEATHEAVTRFVPTQFLAALGKRSITEVVGGEGRGLDGVVLFSDMRSYTTLVERMGPEEAFTFLNAYVSTMEPCIAEHGGFVGQFVGDAILALFPGEADEPLEAALDMLRALDGFNVGREAEPVRCGIGFAAGPWMQGTLGGGERLEAGVVGDVVNRAARIESLTKRYGVRVLLDDATLARLRRPDRYALREVDTVVVKGRTRPVVLYELLDALPPADRARVDPAAFAVGLEAWRAGDLDAARRAFRACAEAGDPVAALYVARGDALGWRAPPGWDGIVRFQTK